MLLRERCPHSAAHALHLAAKLLFVLCVQAHVVNLRDAAAEGSKGLLHPLLKRYHVSTAAMAQHHQDSATYLSRA